MMKKMKLAKQLSVITLLTTLAVLFSDNTTQAQKAPPFSNDIMMDNQTYVFFMADRLEYSSQPGLNPLVWDAQGYVGKDLRKFWYKTEGSVLTGEPEGDMEFQGLYGRAISAYFDLLAGLRYDVAYNRVDRQGRGFAVIGLQGLAPYFFEINGNLFISEAGDISANFEAEYDMPITQRLWGQPRIATSAAVQEVEKWGVGSGFNHIQLGFRLRYEIKREFAPYIGISWNRQLGQTADFVRLEGGETSSLGLVGGVRMWF